MDDGLLAQLDDLDLSLLDAVHLVEPRSTADLARRSGASAATVGRLFDFGLIARATGRSWVLTYHGGALRELVHESRPPS
jgi:predicted transcriptional regulator